MNALVIHDIERLASLADLHRRTAAFMVGENEKLVADVVAHGGTFARARESHVFRKTAERIAVHAQEAEFYEHRAAEAWRLTAAEMVRGGAVQA